MRSIRIFHVTDHTFSIVVNIGLIRKAIIIRKIFQFIDNTILNIDPFQFTTLQIFPILPNFHLKSNLITWTTSWKREGNLIFLFLRPAVFSSITSSDSFSSFAACSILTASTACSSCSFSLSAADFVGRPLLRFSFPGCPKRLWITWSSLNRSWMKVYNKISECIGKIVKLTIFLRIIIVDFQLLSKHISKICLT